MLTASSARRWWARVSQQVVTATNTHLGQCSRLTQATRSSALLKLVALFLTVALIVRTSHSFVEILKLTCARTTKKLHMLATNVRTDLHKLVILRHTWGNILGNDPSSVQYATKLSVIIKHYISTTTCINIFLISFVHIVNLQWTWILYNVHTKE